MRVIGEGECDCVCDHAHEVEVRAFGKHWNIIVTLQPTIHETDLAWHAQAKPLQAQCERLLAGRRRPYRAAGARACRQCPGHPPRALRDPPGGGGMSTLHLAIFDFDLTLSAVHVYYALSGGDSGMPVPPPYARSERGQLAKVAGARGTSTERVGHEWLVVPERAVVRADNQERVAVSGAMPLPRFTRRIPQADAI